MRRMIVLTFGSIDAISTCRFSGGRRRRSVRRREIDEKAILESVAEQLSIVASVLHLRLACQEAHGDNKNDALAESERMPTNPYLSFLPPFVSQGLE